jgi:hypothetical protein
MGIYSIKRTAKFKNWLASLQTVQEEDLED